jgi:transcriptional/translational regulatory protein YebC/TACO1
MGSKGFEPSESEITMRCATDAILNQKEAETMIKLVDALEELDDVQTVHTNAEISDEIIENL